MLQALKVYTVMNVIVIFILLLIIVVVITCKLCLHLADLPALIKSLDGWSRGPPTPGMMVTIKL